MESLLCMSVTCLGCTPRTRPTTVPTTSLWRWDTKFDTTHANEARPLSTNHFARGKNNFNNTRISFYISTSVNTNLQSFGTVHPNFRKWRQSPNSSSGCHHCSSSSTQHRLRTVTIESVSQDLFVWSYAYAWARKPVTQDFLCHLSNTNFYQGSSTKNILIQLQHQLSR